MTMLCLHGNNAAQSGNYNSVTATLILYEKGKETCEIGTPAHLLVSTPIFHHCATTVLAIFLRYLCQELLGNQIRF